ncbi:MAG: ribosome recycling factor [Candidatus Nealsonbacteria bacterium CG07_land_8_20_14_0_80_40_10]|nr:MAG: ribosome recycling factor [Candidatus Nealsonbacteria bacterium CG10_big_fil_rev_8_21_14_0_10_40_24]PIU43620.1 MAG: ribosome recycling factor [Candidatus Nealsonbacteria bacterium CG07_land_8_20_14_0_80_40_10]
MLEQILRELKSKMETVVSTFQEELKKIRTGRANTSLVENVKVQYFANLMPLRELATISAPNPATIIVSPWDKNALGDAELAIRNANLGLNPVNDGVKITLHLPAPTSEERQKLTKIVSAMAEEAKVEIRNLREESWKEIQNLQKQKKLTEDDRYSGEFRLNKIIEEFNLKIKTLTENKEKEILQV